MPFAGDTPAYGQRHSLHRNPKSIFTQLGERFYDWLICWGGR